MEATELYELTVAERRRLATLIGNLTPQQWAAGTLCSGWRVREVVAHLNSSETQTWPEFEAAVAAAEGDIELACDRTARADTARYSDAELLDIYRRRVPSRWTPGPDAHQGALAHEVIHGLDITVALGLPGPEPRVVAAAMAGSPPESLEFFGVDLGGTRLVAADAELTVGAENADAEVRLSAIELTLVVTGRVALSEASSEVA
jgi:uncharacterized protein (TIGR03083 family)